MAKVKVCLNTGCTEWVHLDDGRTIIQTKPKCDIKSVPADFSKQITQIAKDTTETIYAPKGFFKNVKEGEELKL